MHTCCNTTINNLLFVHTKSLIVGQTDLFGQLYGGRSIRKPNLFEHFASLRSIFVKGFKKKHVTSIGFSINKCICVYGKQTYSVQCY